MSLGPVPFLGGGFTASGCDRIICPDWCDPKYLPNCSNDCEESKKCCGGGGGGGGSCDSGGSCGCSGGGDKGFHRDFPFGILPLWMPGGGGGGGQGGGGDNGSCDGGSGSNNPGCVVPSTCIALYPSGFRAASQLSPGERVLSCTETGERCGEEIVSLTRSQQPCVRLETEDGKELLCSLSHEVMVFDPDCPQGRKKSVAEVTLEDRLLLEAGVPVNLVALTRMEDQQVIWIALSGPHHVYLSEGLWSHNKAKPIGPID